MLLLAVFEYASGRPETAFITIAGCARMAYTAGIHGGTNRSRGHYDRDPSLQAKQAQELAYMANVIYQNAVSESQ